MKRTCILLLLLACVAAPRAYAQSNSVALDSPTRLIPPSQVDFYFSFYLDAIGDSVDGCGVVSAPKTAHSPLASVANLHNAYYGRTSYAVLLGNMTNGSYDITPFCSASALGAPPVPAWKYFWTVDMGTNAVPEKQLLENKFYITPDYTVHHTLWYHTAVYRVIDGGGKTVMEFPAEGESTKLDPSRLANGVYTLEAYNPDIHMGLVLRFVKCN